MSSHTAERVSYRIGADENGLGARLGPMLVTAVLARVSQGGERLLRRRLPQALRRDLDDSKRLIAFGRHGLGEAWARALVPEARSPADLLEALSHRPTAELKRRCPQSAFAQCWEPPPERFACDEPVVARVAGHLERLRRRGVEILAVRSSSLCVGELNQLKEHGINRFIADLHAMEQLLLSLRETAGHEIFAICGKVGGIGDYPRYFGPLSGRLHVVLEHSRRKSAYAIPGLGEVHFLQDADATDPLVMLASLVGKYLRELLMARISHFHSSPIDGQSAVSGYHDPVTERLVRLSARRRGELGLPDDCFERSRGE